MQRRGLQVISFGSGASLRHALPHRTTAQCDAPDHPVRLPRQTMVCAAAFSNGDSTNAVAALLSRRDPVKLFAPRPRA
eukprot:scaffold14519_cov135-Isochrysis_galbana.AAC.3